MNQVNQDFKYLTHRPNASKIYLNVSKTEVALFKSSRKLRCSIKTETSWKKTSPYKVSKNLMKTLTGSNRFLI